MLHTDSWMIRPDGLATPSPSNDPVSDLLARVAEALPTDLVMLLDARLPEIARSMAGTVQRDMAGPRIGPDIAAPLPAEHPTPLPPPPARRPPPSVHSE